jgi:hypothetical protein
MACIFMDGCELQSTYRWDSGVGWNATGGRRGGASHSTNQNAFWKAFPAQATYIIGVAFKPSQVSNCGLVAFYEGGTNHVDVRIISGKLRVTRNGTQLGSDGPTTISAGVWYFFEVKATIHDTTGAVEVRIGSTPEIVLTNQDTRNGGTGVIDTLYCGPNNSQGEYCDIRIFDTTGAVNNDFAGDAKVETSLPTAEGNSSDFTPSSGSDNALMVDENSTGDGDSTYNASSTVGHKDLHVLANLATVSGDVLAVQVTNNWRKDDAGAATARRVVRTGGTDFEGPDVTLLDTYVRTRELIEENPDTLAPWTITDVNALQAGYKREA